MQERTWDDDIFDALTTLKRPSPLKEIYREVKRIRDLRGETWPPSGNDHIRKIIQQSSSDTKSQPKKADLYYSAGGIGKGIWGIRNTLVLSQIETAELPTEERGIIEGEILERTVLSYKRNAGNVKRCKERDQYTCKACEFHFKNKIVECHHLKPLHIHQKSIVSTDELVTLCPTCHRVAHHLIREGFKEYADKNLLIKAIQESTNA